METIFKNKIEEITDGFLVVIMAAMTGSSLNLEKSSVKDQKFLDIVASLGLEKRTILRIELLKEVEKASEEIAEEINELETCFKH